MGAVLRPVAFPHPEAEAFAQRWEAEDASSLRLLRLCTPLSAGARVLGYEVVGAEETLDLLSWHCRGYADEVRTDLGIRRTDQGLIPDVTAARKVLSWMLARPTDQAPEPVPWTVACLAADSHSSPGAAPSSGRCSVRWPRDRRSG